MVSWHKQCSCARASQAVEVQPKSCALRRAIHPNRLLRKQHKNHQNLQPPPKCPTALLTHRDEVLPLSIPASGESNFAPPLPTILKNSSVMRDECRVSPQHRTAKTLEACFQKKVSKLRDLTLPKQSATVKLVHRWASKEAALVPAPQHEQHSRRQVTRRA